MLAPLCAAAHAHPGGLAADGCHNDRRAGTCHCHRVGAARAGCALGATRAGDESRARHAPAATRTDATVRTDDDARADTTARARDDSRSTHAARTDASRTDTARYRRDDWLPRWDDADGDCQNTRHEVLIAESRAPVTLSPDGCWVRAGEWRDPYTGDVVRDPRALDIDHLVPLAEAHRSGGAQWSRARKRAFANDLQLAGALVATRRGENRRKGARDPARWMPTDPRAHCAYVRNWVRVKRHWGLAMDAAEARAIEQHRARCERRSRAAADAEDAAFAGAP